MAGEATRLTIIEPLAPGGVAPAGQSWGPGHTVSPLQIGRPPDTGPQNKLKFLPQKYCLFWMTGELAPPPPAAWAGRGFLTAGIGHDV